MPLSGDAATRVDIAAFEPLASRAVGGDVEAWKELVSGLWPVLHRIVRSSPVLGALRRSDDHVGSVVIAVVEKLGRDRGHGLTLYFSWRDRHPGKGFDDWVSIVTANAARDYVRRETCDASAYSGEIGQKRLLNEFLASPARAELGHRPPITVQQTARQILEFAEEHLSVEQHRALAGWLEGGSFEEIAREGMLPCPDDAKKLVRAAVATLRRAFSAPSAPDEEIDTPP